MEFPFFLILLHLFSCCYPLMPSTLSLFAPFFSKKRVWSSCFVWQKLLLLHPLCKRDKVFSWNVDKAPVGFDLCGFTFKKKLLWKFGSEAKKSLSLQSGSQKRIFFCLGLRSCQKSFRRRKRKKTFKKNFRKHLVVTFKLLTFAPALENKAKIKEAFFDRIT